MCCISSLRMGFKMKLSKLALVMGFGIAFAANMAHAAGTSEGVVNFKGILSEAPCSLASDSLDQTVDFGDLSIAGVQAGTDSSLTKNVPLVLTGCSIATSGSASVTFTGAASLDVPGTLAVTGTATGVGIALIDPANQPVVLGTPTTAQPLSNGTNTLLYTATVKAGSTAPTAGNFQAISNFTITYL